MGKKKKVRAEEREQASAAVAASDASNDANDLPPDEQAEPPHEDRQPAFPIIGIGASAGGLEAFEAFFEQMPPDSGMAFVLVQHLDPDHESILVDLLKRATLMPVSQVTDGLLVQPDHVYVIPPDRNMALLNGALHLLEPVEPRGHRMPVDYLFRSLADDQADRAVCIILSGTGSDGTKGLRAIQSAGGMSMVQEPETASYDGMPRSAIRSSQIDYILPPGEMPEQLLNYIRRLHTPSGTTDVPPPSTEAEALEKIFILLRRQTKHDFSQYKLNTINRRIERRMVVNHIERISDYIRYLQQTPLEVDTLFRELLIGVTSFFRDPETFAVLEQHAIPRLFENRQIDQPIRVWVPGCSTGEEAYSIAMLIREQMSQQQAEYDVQIFATDIDNQAIEIARLGVYPDGIAADISSERLQHYFTKTGSTYRIAPQIREMVVFAVQSVVKDPPFSKMDLISCRNLLIYMGAPLQKKVIPLFHYALKPGGYLFLGTSETLGEYNSFFNALDRKAKLFQSVPGDITLKESLDFTTPRSADDRLYPVFTKPDKVLNVREITEQVLLKDYTPPCVIINDQTDILFFHGKTGPYLEPASGEASFNLLRMAREGLQLPLNTTLRKAFAEKQEVVYENIILYTGEDQRLIDLIVRPIVRPVSLQGLFMVVFEERSPPGLSDAVEITDIDDEHARRLTDMERELQSTREYLQTTIEELETTNEELKSTNEELQSSNEELQSTNEEMETSKEELQSVNEELVTVNSELQNKIDDLSNVNNDLHNLLANIEIGIVFVDQNLRIQRFNPAATMLINLIDTDVGRPIGHIVSNLLYADLVHDARAVLDTLNSKEIEVQTEDDRWFQMYIRPYRTVENTIDGLVITFAEVTEQKQLALLAEAARQYADGIVETVRDALLVLDSNLRVVSANATFYASFQVKPEETEGQLIYELGNRQWDIPSLRELLEQLLLENGVFDNYRVEHAFKEIGKRTMLLNARQIQSVTGREALILLAIEDITET